MIVTYRNWGISFCVIALRTDRNSTTVMRKGNQWVIEGHTEWNVGSPRHPITNTRDDRHIVRHILHLESLVRKLACLQPAHYPLVSCDDVCSSEDCQQCDHYFDFP
ncbi:hypothetical protein TNCV_3103081 [Trichonephila clavipes]|nr:hypothetical protein TNCV_3103081 [Trichonephila clavipes]